MKGKGRKGKTQAATIAELLETLKGREVPVLSQGSSLEEAIHMMARFPHSRLLYVVDGKGRLTGTVSLATLVRHVFFRSHEPQIHPRFLINAIVTEAVVDIMERHPISATGEEDVEAVLKRMIEKNVNEIAALDTEKRLIGDITMIDLLAFLIARRED
ncbi:MAG: CBS domain-containing protein [Deltaproteobacteria bacterium]|nr:CBS domain-containing protein [Deltaproteobacteria bacterium]